MGGNVEGPSILDKLDDINKTLEPGEKLALEDFSKEDFETDTKFQESVSKFTDQAKQLKNGTLNAEDLTEENIALIQLSVSLFMLDGENDSQSQIDGEAKTLQSLINEITITDTSSTTPQQTEKNEKINSKERLELLGHSGQAYAEYIKELAGSMEGIVDFGIPDQLYDMAQKIELRLKDIRGNVQTGSMNIETIIDEIFPDISSVYEELKVAMVEDAVPEDINEDDAPTLNLNKIQNLANAKTNRMFQRKMDKVTPYVQDVKSAFTNISSSTDFVEIEKTFYNNLNTLIKNDLNGSTLNRDAIKDRITDTGRLITEAEKQESLKSKLKEALGSIDTKTMKRLFGNKESILEGALRHEFRNNNNFDKNLIFSDVFDEVSDKILDMRENADSGMQRQVDNMKKELTHLIQKDPSTLSDQGRKRILRIKTLIDPANKDQLKKVYDESILITGINMLKVSAQNSVLENNKELWEGKNDNELTKLYADIEGVESYDLSDKNSQLLEDGAFMMASEIVLFASGMKLASVVTQGAIKLTGKAAVGQGIKQTATRITATAAGVTSGYGLNESGRSLVNNVPVEKWAEQYTFAKFATFGATLGILKLVQGMPSLQNINLKTTPISKAKALAKRFGFEEGMLLGSEFIINGGDLSAEDVILAAAMGAAFESKFGLEIRQNAKYTRDVNGDIILDGLNGKDLLKAKKVKNSERTSKLIDKDHQRVILGNMLIADNPTRISKGQELLPNITHYPDFITKAHEEGGARFGELYLKEINKTITPSEKLELNQIRGRKRRILMNKGNDKAEGKGYSKDEANTLMDYGIVGRWLNGLKHKLGFTPIQKGSLLTIGEDIRKILGHTKSMTMFQIMEDIHYQVEIPSQQKEILLNFFNKYPKIGQKYNKYLKEHSNKKTNNVDHIYELWAHGIDSTVQQSTLIGNCYYVNAMNILKTFPDRIDLLSKVIKKTSTGYDIHLLGTKDNNILSFTHKDIEEFKDNPRVANTENLGDILLEMAYARHRRNIAEQRTGTIARDGDSHTYILDKMDHEGGHLMEPFTRMFGPEFSGSIQPASEISNGKSLKNDVGKRYLMSSPDIEGLLELDDVSLQSYFPNKDINLIKSDLVRQLNSEKQDALSFRVENINGDPVDIFLKHAYAILEVSENGEYFILQNPHDSSIQEKIPMRTLSMFESIETLTRNVNIKETEIVSTHLAGNTSQVFQINNTNNSINISVLDYNFSLTKIGDELLVTHLDTGTIIETIDNCTNSHYLDKHGRITHSESDRALLIWYNDDQIGVQSQNNSITVETE